MAIASPVRFPTARMLGKRSRRNRPTIYPAFKILTARVWILIQLYGRFLKVGDSFKLLEAEVQAELRGLRTYLHLGDTEAEFTAMLTEVGDRITDSQAKDNTRTAEYGAFERSACEAEIAFKAGEFARRFRSQANTSVGVTTLAATMARIEQSHADFVRQFQLLGKNDSEQKEMLVRQAKDVLFGLLVMFSNWMWARAGWVHGWTSVRVGLHGFQ